MTLSNSSVIFEVVRAQSLMMMALCRMHEAGDVSFGQEVYGELIKQVDQHHSVMDVLNSIER